MSDSDIWPKSFRCIEGGRICCVTYASANDDAQCSCGARLPYSFVSKDVTRWKPIDRPAPPTPDPAAELVAAAREAVNALRQLTREGVRVIDLDSDLIADALAAALDAYEQGGAK